MASPPRHKLSEVAAPPSARDFDRSSAPTEGTSPKVMRSITVRVLKPTDTLPNIMNRCKTVSRGGSHCEALC